VPGDYVVVEVSDTGAGMSEEVIAKIFEPFFTTKPSGLGTGLGLSMVFGFVAQSGGFVRVRSAPKSGATFSLYFPRATESVRQRTLPAELAVTHSARGETVLAVEDEVALLRVVERELIELGFRVRTAADGEAALAILEREEIDILLSDVVMPGAVDGFALAETVRGRWPAIRIVLTSGYLGTGNDLYDRRWKRMENFVSLLRKPYRRRELAAALHGVAIRPQAEARGAP
jgi:CheY-like chemotaxis protein